MLAESPIVVAESPIVVAESAIGVAESPTVVAESPIVVPLRWLNLPFVVAESPIVVAESLITKGSVSYLSSPSFSTIIGGIGGPALVKRRILGAMY